MFAAVASMVAVMDAEGAGGRGEHIDVSIQEAVAMALENSVPFYDLEGRVRKRTGLTQRYTGAGLFPCSDGYIYVFVGGLAAIGFWDGFVEWMCEAGAGGAEQLRGARWHERAFRETQEARDIFAEVFAPFASKRKQMELYLEAQERRIPMSPVSTAANVANNPQLQARGFFVDVEHPASGRTLRMPGAPYLLSRTPWRNQRPAPRLGEHNAEIFGEIGVSAAELASLAHEKVI
jgi:benzylsuccinate CoA-transferase BbsE subunit